MPTIPLDRMAAYRNRTYRMAPDLRITSQEEAIDFVNERGFVLFHPSKGVTLPSLWNAVAGDRPVPNQHDDPGHVTWSWKDALLGARRWYYAKVLRKRSTIIALDVAPYFYALSENYGSPEFDYLDQYERGTMSQEAKLIYETLLQKGALNKVDLRKATFMTSKDSHYRFNRGLDELQADFKVLPIGVAQAGAWRYAFIYECVHRFYPDLPEKARAIGIGEAQRTLAESYFRSVGAAEEGDVAKVFQWSKRDLTRALDALAEAGTLVEAKIEKGGAGYALPELV